MEIFTLIALFSSSEIWQQKSNLFYFQTDYVINRIKSGTQATSK